MQKFAGATLLLIGLVGSCLGIVEIVAPVGTKLADDRDPFGTPRTLGEAFGSTVPFVVVLLVGGFLIFREAKGSSGGS